MKFFKTDGFLKILSVIIAIALWFYVVQVHNPDMEKTFRNIPVVFSQKADLESNALTLLNDKDITIDVQIKGNRKNIMRLAPTDITVVADLSAIEEKGTHTVVTTVMLPYGNLEVVNKKPSTLKVEVDDLETAIFPITVTPIGTTREGFIFNKAEIMPEEITVKGAKTILGGIHSVVAEVDVTGASTDFTSAVSPKIFDSNGKEINLSYVKFGTDSINVRCEILKTKAVKIKPSVIEEIITDEFTYQLDKNSLPAINVKGSADLLEKLTFVDVVFITAINESGEAKVKLILPEGVSSVDGDTFTIRYTKQTMN
ncbi:MAG: hypothetical protein E7407_01950 [Ruminococcaceae bacterium]|nr:hypothetical protein [Oscillospiraceae bacterium]